MIEEKFSENYILLYRRIYKEELYMKTILNMQWGTRKDTEDWKRKYEEVRKEYKRELLSNQAWTHAILQLALVGKIDAETQNLLYKMHNNEMEFVYEKLL